MNQNGSQDLHTLADSLRGLRCWHVSLGGCTLPTFQLALGEKVPRAVPLRNPTHSEEYRRCEGEANLLVWCTWRLDGPDGPVTSSDDSSSAIENGLMYLLHRQIESLHLTAPAWDLTLRFSNDYQLHIFCDHLPGDPSFDGNWELSFQEATLYVGPGDRYVIERRADVQVGASVIP